VEVGTREATYLLRPSLVDKAIQIADSMGFTDSCLEDVGELLHLLAGHIRNGTIAEIGTGRGVGTAWIASATTMDVYTIDHDQERAVGIRRFIHKASKCSSDCWRLGTNFARGAVSACICRR
jgi:predicted O-methyltransferase YrrM